MPKQRRSESGKEATIGRGMDGPEKSEAKVEDKGESEEAAAEIEDGGRRKEIAEIKWSRLKSRVLFCLKTIIKSGSKELLLKIVMV